MKPLHDQYAQLVRSGPNGLFSAGDLSRIEAHAEDGVAGADLIRGLGASSIVDIGSGGGVPGIQLAIELDHATVHLVESQGWKADFLRTCARALGLESRLRVWAERVEEVPQLIGRECVDVGVARAVAAPGVVAEYLAPLIRPGGHLVLWSTAAQAADLDPTPGQRRLGLGEPSVVPSSSPLRDQGVFLVWPKPGSCDADIPRRTGVAARRPLR